jgi:hypothetical protein
MVCAEVVVEYRSTVFTKAPSMYTFAWPRLLDLVAIHATLLPVKLNVALAPAVPETLR